MGKTPKRSSREIRLELIKFELPAGRERSFAEWMHERALKYRELRSHPINNGIIDAAEAFQVIDKLNWFRKRDAMTGESLGLASKQISVPTKLSAHAIASRAYARSAKMQEVATISEALAFQLILREGKLKDAEASGSSSAPVRMQGLLSRRSISDIAVDLLDCCYALSAPPGPQLIGLIESLLKASPMRLKFTRQFDARQEAISIDARQPGLSIRALAEMIGVHGTTVMRWRKDPSYQKAVQERQRWLARERDSNAV
jgi:hypothetical protein